MKKLIAILLSVIVVLTGFVIIVSAAMPEIKVSSVQVKPGDVVKLSVTLENNPGINTFSLGFDYDELKLRLMNVTVNEDLGGQFIYVEKAVWLNDSDINYNGEILTLEFKVLHTAKNGETEVKATYAPGDIANYDEKNVNFRSVGGTITIGEEESEQTSFWQKILSFFVWIYEGIIELFSFVN